MTNYSETSIEHGNMLIADFMGLVRKAPNNYSWLHQWWKLEPNKKENTFMGYDDSLEYHSSWDWLMPVVDKIIDIDITPAPNWSGYRVEIVPRGYVRISGFPMHSISKNVSLEGSLKNAVWSAVVEFIEYYNINH